MIELKDFILEKLDSCKKITLSFRIVHTDTESTKKNNEILTKRLKEPVLPYITHNNIIHKHLYRNGLHLNLIGFSVLAENFLSYIRTNCRNETHNQMEK